jgi:hypothetical protein
MSPFENHMFFIFPSEKAHLFTFPSEKAPFLHTPPEKAHFLHPPHLKKHIFFVSPFEKGGRGDLTDQRISYPSINYLNHFIRIRQHLPAVEPQRFQSQTGQILIAFVIPHRTFILQVLGSIDFNHQIGFGCVKIDNKIANRFLSVKLHTQYLLSSQPRPECPFAAG